MLPPACAGCRWTKLPLVGRNIKAQSGIQVGIWILLDIKNPEFGGAGGNRTRVRKSSTDGSTCLALPT